MRYRRREQETQVKFELRVKIFGVFQSVYLRPSDLVHNFVLYSIPVLQLAWKFLEKGFSKDISVNFHISTTLYSTYMEDMYG